MQMKEFAGLTEEKAKQIPKDERDKQCALLNALSPQLKAVVKGCNPDLLDLATKMCAGDGKEDKTWYY